MTTLIIDSRETNVTRHSEELAGTPIIRRMITVGDYAIVDGTGRVLVSIERKSLEDYAASIKDGRISNIAKMTKLREETGCRLVLLIEGRPGAKHGGIPYKALESSMWHVAFRHHITLLFTRSTVETAGLLARLVVSINTMQNGHSPMIPGVFGPITGAPNEVRCTSVPTSAETTTEVASTTGVATTTEAPMTGGADANPQAAPPQEGTLGEIPATLTAARPKTTHEIARSILSVIPGITMDSADEYLKYYSAADILRGADVHGVKLASGKAPTKRVIAGVNAVRKTQTKWISMLTRVPGVTTAAATELLKHASLPTLLTWSKESIGIITIGTRPGKDGAVVQKKLPGPVAARILECFGFNLKP